MRLFSHTPSVEASDVAERIASRQVYVLDVRQPAEYRRGHIKGSLNVPLPDLRKQLDGFRRDKPVVAVCASGHRSKAAVRMLENAGFEAANLAHGMRGWARAGLPVQRS